MISCMLGIIIIMLFGFSSAEIIGRFVFDYPLPWVNEVCRFLLIWMVFLGASEVTRIGGHLTVGVSVLRFVSEKAQFWIRIFVNSLICIALSVIGYYASVATYYSGQIVAPASQIPMWVVWSAIPVNFFLMVLFTLHDTVRLCRGEVNLHENTMVEKEGN